MLSLVRREVRFLAKEIICYHTNRSHVALRPNMISLADGFRALGCAVTECDLDNRADTDACYTRLLSDGNAIAFTVGNNDLGMVLHDENGAPYYPYDAIDTPHVSVMLDVPYNPCVTGFDTPCRHHIATLLDRHVAPILPLAWPKKRMAGIFLPLGGTQALTEEQVFSAARPYDVVVSGVFPRGEAWPRRRWHEEGLPAAACSILDEAADRLELEPKNSWDGVLDVLAARGFSSDAFKRRMLPYLPLMQRYIKQYRRLKAVEFLVRAGITPDVFGDGWEGVPFADGLRLHGPVPYEEMLAIMGKAKVVYQDNAEFANGAHDRVFTAMLNGAVVVSEESTYLAEAFENGKDIVLFDWKTGAGRVAESVPVLIADETLRLSFALRAYGKAKAHHTWRNRAARIAEAVELLYGV